MGRKSRGEPGELVHNTIATVRAERGLTRQALADAVGVHYQTIGYLERNEYSPSLALALRLAAALGHRVEDLFSLDEPGRHVDALASRSGERHTEGSSTR